MSRELVVLRENRNSLAVRHGLPPIGATMSNQHGIVWRVDGHFFAPTLATLARGPVVADNPRDLFPVLHPQNLSPRLLEFIAETDRCTSKQFLLLDTMPHLRPGEAHPEGHWVDAWSNPSFIPVFLDAAHAHETVIAHEIGHVWIDLVDDCEDYRVLRDLSDTAKVHQWTSIQSFVLDRKVNEVLRRKGFDTNVMDAQLGELLASLACALLAGYQPPSRAEAAFLAIPLATAILDGEMAANDTLQSPEMATLAIECHLPDVYDLACQMAASVRECGYFDRASIRRSIDACAALSFAFTGQSFEVERDLVEEPPEECFADKYPQCFAGLPVRAKLEIGRVMAKQRISAGTDCRLSSSPAGKVQIEFCDEAGTWTAPILLHHAPRLPHDMSEVCVPVPGKRATTKHLTLLTPQMRTQPPAAPSPSVPLFPSLLAVVPHLPTTSLSASRRHYNTGTALFLARVRLWEQIGGEHPYAYATNNPITYTDPSGNVPQNFSRPPKCSEVKNCLSDPARKPCRHKSSLPESNDVNFMLCIFQQETSFLARPSAKVPGSGGKEGIGNVKSSAFYQLKKSDEKCVWIRKFRDYNDFVSRATDCEKAQAAQDYLASKYIATKGKGLHAYGPGKPDKGEYTPKLITKLRTCAKALASPDMSLQWCANHHMFSPLSLQWVPHYTPEQEREFYDSVCKNKLTRTVHLD